jgi:hypothetical protein
VQAGTLETLRGGRYVVLGTLGEGAQGRTFDGVDKREGRPVAIKRFDVRGARSWKDVELAEREARVLQSLSHPLLPRYVEHFEEAGALYLVMEKMEGESLAAIRRRGASLDEKEVWRLLEDASRVLDYLHGRAPPVIHRDLKPGNAIRRPDGSFAFVDFGAVRDKLRPEGGSTVVGTFGYMAPEQFQGRALPASDVYAVGATALTTLTGCEPEQLPHQGLAIDVRGALRGRGSERLAAVLEKMLQPDPTRRASRIAPLLEGRAERRREAPERYRDATDRSVGRRERRKARRQARRIERAARRRQRGQHGVPFPFSLFLALAFTLGIVAVSIATQLVAPLVLLILSPVFGKRLAEAAGVVRDGGRTAIGAMRRSRAWLRGESFASDGGGAAPEQQYPGEGPRIRVEQPASAPRTRVAAEADVGAEEAAEDDRERAESGSKAGRP